MKYTVTQVKELIADGGRAVACTISLGGWELEAFALDGRYLARVFDNDEPTLYAVLTEQEYNSLYDATAWGRVGAQSDNDAAIVSAANRWYKQHTDDLKWYRLSSNGKTMVRYGD